MASASQDLSVVPSPRYRAISPWAILSVVCGAATTLMFYPLDWFASPFPLAAIYFGVKALGQIDRLPEEYTGQRLAKIGIGLGVGLGILIGGWIIICGNGVPYGYQELDWAALAPDPNDKHESIPDSAFKLDDPAKTTKVKVYARGYMIAGRRQIGLTEFSICRTSDQCRFGNKASYRPTDLIRIELTGDRTINYTTHEIGVGGIFHVDKDSPTPYGIQADYLRN